MHSNNQFHTVSNLLFSRQALRLNYRLDVVFLNFLRHKKIFDHPVHPQKLPILESLQRLQEIFQLSVNIAHNRGIFLQFLTVLSVIFGHHGPILLEARVRSLIKVLIRFSDVLESRQRSFACTDVIHFDNSSQNFIGEGLDQLSFLRFVIFQLLKNFVE